MPARALLFIGILFSAACYTHEEYLMDEADATCTWYERCDNLGTLGYASWQECFDEVSAWDEAEPPACEDYDAGTAKDCIEGLNLLPCQYEPSQYPSACAAVCSGGL